MIKVSKEFMEEHFNLSILKYAKDQRWYSHKSKHSERLSILNAFFLEPGNTILALICEITFASNETALYYIPLELSNLEGGNPIDYFSENGLYISVRDAFLSQGYADSLVKNFVLGSTIFDGASSLSFTRTEYFNEPESREFRPVRSEQSNSSFVLGNSMIVKNYRNLKSGENPDIDVPVKLAAHGNFLETPKPMGFVTYSGKAGKIYVAYASQFIANSSDAWVYYNNLFGTSLRENFTDDNFAENFQTEFLGIAGNLAGLTGRMHRSLSSINDPLFTPKDAEKKDIIETVSRIRKYVETADTIIVDSNTISANLKTKFIADVSVADLEHVQEYLLSRLEKSHAKKIRVHGDYHLGQILVSKGEYYVIDFEGEPMRNMAERIRLYPPEKDMAGMVRSLDYLLESIYKRSNGTINYEFIDAMRMKSEEAFANAYRESMGDRSVLLGIDSGFSEMLLRLFVAEKSAYELIYELNNRPDWVDVPMKAISRIFRDIKRRRYSF